MAKGGKTLERLSSLNIRPSEIKAVYLTHSHYDHIGGLLSEAGEGVFPNAAVYVSSDEMAFMKKTMGSTVDQLENAYGDRLKTLLSFPE